MMNIIEASRLRAVIETNINTIVGGVASEITTAQDFANLTSLNVSEITNFKIVGEDIQMYITENYGSDTGWFQSIINPTKSNAITAFIDFDGKYINSGNEAFKGCSAKIIYTPNNNFISFKEVRDCKNLKIFYSPKQTPVSSSSLNNEVFNNNTNCEFYTNIANQTVNSGSPDADITELLSNGGYVIYKDLNNTNQTTAPTAPTISTNVIGGTYAELSVSQPTHVNNLKYALVFVDGFFQNLYHISSGIYALNLQEQTSYNIKVIIADEYFNISPYSDALNVTTTTTPALFQNAVAYYKQNELSGQALDLINAYNGVDFGTIVKDGEWYNYGTNASYVEIANNDDFSFVDSQGNNTDFVIKTEVIFDGFNSQNRAWLVSKRESITAVGQEWQLIRNEGTGQTSFAIWDDNNTLHIIRHTAPVVIGQKYILGVTFINNELRLFVDGVRVATEPVGLGVTFANTSSVIKLGNETFTTNLNLVGRQKETVFIKGKGWTDGEISDNYNNRIGTTI